MGVRLMNTRDHYFPLKIFDCGDLPPRPSYFFFFFAAFFFVAIVNFLLKNLGPRRPFVTPGG